jgi:hypothetical protein
MWKEDEHKIAVYQKTYEWITHVINKGNAPDFKPPGDFKVGRMLNPRFKPHKRRFFGLLCFVYLFIGFLFWILARFLKVSKIKI